MYFFNLRCFLIERDLCLFAQENNALNFAGTSGLVIKLGQYQTKDDVMKIDCAVFSCYDERETLFFGGDTVLRIKGVMQCVGGKWCRYDKFITKFKIIVFRLHLVHWYNGILV